MSVDKENEIRKETFWEDVGAITMVYALAIYVSPWLVISLLIAKAPTELLPLGLAGLIAFAPLWILTVFLTIDPFQRLVRTQVVKDKIKGRQKRKEQKDKHSQNIQELNEWIHTKGFHYEGEEQHNA